MKLMVTTLALLFSLGLFGQQLKPKYERVDDMVKATFYHDNGEIAQTGYFLDGKLHGEWIMYNSKGEKIAMGQYENGKKTGKWFFWDENGLREVDYNNNAVTSIVNWQNTDPVVVFN